MAMALMAGVRPPDWFGASRMVFVPRARGAVSLGHGEVATMAGDRRPLSLSSTDNRPIASFVGVVLRQAASEWCSSAQLGDAVMLLEPALHGVRRSDSGGLFFINLRAAFPSVRRRWKRARACAHAGPSASGAPSRQLVPGHIRHARGWRGAAGDHPHAFRHPSGVPRAWVGLCFGNRPVLKEGGIAASPSPYNRIVGFADVVAADLHRFVDVVAQMMSQLSDIDIAFDIGLVLAPARIMLLPLWAEDSREGASGPGQQAPAVGRCGRGRPLRPSL